MQTSRASAVKAFYYEAPFESELEIYEYLKRWGVFEVAGFHIPELIDFDRSQQVIEMSVVMPPYILDFVDALIERPIERDEDQITALAEIFEDDWPRVKIAIWQLEEHGVYLGDVHPRNICCR
ncbi:hypothetical protein [Schlesneria sp. T3-172]|uniref:hypothetical protein n=1 Tax=Schlesneria TaxID=656899 RepID=UPI002EE67879